MQQIWQVLLSLSLSNTGVWLFMWCKYTYFITGMLKYGRGSIHSTQQLLDDVCRDLHCQRDRYTWTSHPALEGTFCGTNKVNKTLHSIQNSDNIFEVLLMIKIQISMTQVTKCKLYMISLNYTAAARIIWNSRFVGKWLHSIVWKLLHCNNYAMHSFPNLFLPNTNNRECSQVMMHLHSIYS